MTTARAPGRRRVPATCGAPSRSTCARSAPAPPFPSATSRRHARTDRRHAPRCRPESPVSRHRSQAAVAGAPPPRRVHQVGRVPAELVDKTGGESRTEHVLPEIERRRRAPPPVPGDQLPEHGGMPRRLVRESTRAAPRKPPARQGPDPEPVNSPPPPHSEYSCRLTPRACIAATSRCRNASDVFGKVVNRYAAVIGGSANPPEHAGRAAPRNAALIGGNRPEVTGIRDA